MSLVGDNIEAGDASWSFSGKTVDTFEEHVKKSVPLYVEGHDLIVRLSDFFVKDDSICYEIGCSTGALTQKIAKRHAIKNAKFIGIDLEQDMIEKANELYVDENIEFVCDNVIEYEFPNFHSDLIMSYYTIQFIRPSERQKLINKIYDTLKWGGAFMLFEKVRAPDARFQDICTAVYNDYKLERGYTPDEIIHKSKSLKGVLEPFSSSANLDMLKRAGFVDVMNVMKYIPFEGFLCIK
ncbi:MAG: methyltransferase domain-containing protein [Opitutales bacterium]|nr:methyltransferase domain-containing protein [Opitutales bacterium]